MERSLWDARTKMGLIRDARSTWKRIAASAGADVGGGQTAAEVVERGPDHGIHGSRVGETGGEQLLHHFLSEQGDPPHGGSGRNPQALVSVVKSVEHALIENLQIVRDQGVAGVAEEVIEIAQASCQPARGVGVASGKDQLGILEPEPLGGLANDGGCFAVVSSKFFSIFHHCTCLLSVSG